MLKRGSEKASGFGGGFEGASGLGFRVQGLGLLISNFMEGRGGLFWAFWGWRGRGDNPKP